MRLRVVGRSAPLAALVRARDALDAGARDALDASACVPPLPLDGYVDAADCDRLAPLTALRAMRRRASHDTPACKRRRVDVDDDDALLVEQQREMARVAAVGKARALLRFADDTFVVRRRDACDPLLVGSYEVPSDDELTAARAALLRSTSRVRFVCSARETRDCAMCMRPLDDALAARELVRFAPRCADHAKHSPQCALVRHGACLPCVAAALGAEWRTRRTHATCPLCRAHVCEDDVECVVDVARE